MSNIRLANSKEAMAYLVKYHYLHRPVIRTKTLSYWIEQEGKIVGCIMWATPHFTKKKGLFGFSGLLDKWEVLVLSRFYLDDTCTLSASEIIAEVIGKAGRKSKSKRKGWRIQNDWVQRHPPRFIKNPFVPRLLLSWADRALQEVPVCNYCSGNHKGKHTGIIYQASGWKQFDVTKSSGVRTGLGGADGDKISYVLSLGENPKVQQLGVNLGEAL